MPLSRPDWCLRVGIPPPLIEQTSDPSAGAALIGKLTIWRYDTVMDIGQKHTWNEAVRRGLIGQQGRSFYHELLNKKLGLYGHGVSSTIDFPMDLARHPWAMRENEFASAYAAVTNDQAPTMVPDDRARVSAAIGLTAGAVGGVGAALSFVPHPVTKVVGTAVRGVGSIIGGVAGIIAGAAWILDNAAWSEIKSQLPGLKGVYEREKQYRVRERNG